MHADPIQTCFGFVIDPPRVLLAIHLKLLPIVVLGQSFLIPLTVFARLKNRCMQTGYRRRTLCLVIRATLVKGVI